MSGKTVSGVIPQPLYEIAQQAVEYEGTTMSALVSSALALYLGLSGSARRSARYVLASGPAESREVLLEGCAGAIAVAGDQALTAQLAVRGRAAGFQENPPSEEAVMAEAVQAVREARRIRRNAGGQEKAAQRR